MRIGMDLRFTASSHMGTGVYAETAAHDLVDSFREGDSLVGLGAPDELGRRFDRRVKITRIPPPFPCVQGDLAERLLWDSAIARAGLDVFFAPTGLAPLVKCCPVVITIHDLLFEHAPEYFSPPLLSFLKREIPRSVEMADRIVAVSESTRCDLVNMYGIPSERITVVHQGLQRSFRERPIGRMIQRALKSLAVKQPYFLVLSNLAPHKNLAFAVKVFAEWRRRHNDTKRHLVIAGGGPSPQAPSDIGGLVRDSRLDNWVKWLGRVNDDDLPCLMAGAELFLFPSLYEGWGLPPVEAISMGTPTLVSDRGALPEAVGEAGAVLPLDESTWVSTIDRFVRNGVPVELRHAMEQRKVRLVESRGPILRKVFDQAIKEFLCLSAPARQPAEGADDAIRSRPVSTASAPATAEPIPHDQAMALYATSGLGDQLLLSTLAERATKAYPGLRIWLGTWPGDLPRPDFVATGEVPSYVRRIDLGYGQSIQLACAREFPGTLQQRMTEEFNRKTGLSVPFPERNERPFWGAQRARIRDDHAIVMMAHGEREKRSAAPPAGKEGDNLCVRNPSKEWGYERYCELARLLKGHGWRVMHGIARAE